MPQVTRLAITPVKGTRLQAIDRVRLEEGGVRENRRFYIVDHNGRMLNGKVLGDLNAVVAEYDDARRWLGLRFPDGELVAAAVELDEEIPTRFFSRMSTAHPVRGPWAEALSRFSGRPLQLVEAGETSAVDRGDRGALSLISRASLDELARQGGYDDVDSRRFRMLVEVNGVAAHQEDGWVGCRARVGDAVVSFDGHVGRCLVTSRDPDTGQIDMPTLDILGAYRGEVQSTEPLPFGIYGSVVKPGVVRVGDSVSLCDG